MSVELFPDARLMADAAVNARYLTTYGDRPGSAPPGALVVWGNGCSSAANWPLEWALLMTVAVEGGVLDGNSGVAPDAGAAACCWR